MNVLKLIEWFKENQRDLVFRKTKDPYHVWVSEIMLQQTQVDTVLPYFVRFINTFKTIEDLANAPYEHVLKSVEGLGYYRRFRNMHQAAQVLLNEYDGIFPKTYQEVLKLPGIGKYTAGAIMSICYDEPYGAVDGNVIRVLSRVFAIDQDMRVEKNKKVIESINQDYIIKAKPSLYTQAVMELGALICRPVRPKCEICPLQSDCRAFLDQNVEQYPVMSPLKPKVAKHFITLLLYKEDKIILKKRTETLLEGMYEYPQVEAESIHYVLSYYASMGIHIEVLRHKRVYQHVFTHMIWNMDVYEAKLTDGMDPSWEVFDNHSINLKPMAVAHLKIKK